jgi:hypothetical protein
MFIIKTKEGALLNLDQWEGVKIDKSKIGIGIVAFNDQVSGQQSRDFLITTCEKEEDAIHLIEDIYQTIINGGKGWRA